MERKKITAEYLQTITDEACKKVTDYFAEICEGNDGMLLQTLVTSTGSELIQRIIKIIDLAQEEERFSPETKLEMCKLRDIQIEDLRKALDGVK